MKTRIVYATSLLLCLFFLQGQATASAFGEHAFLTERLVEKEITGLVADSTGSPLSGISVIVKGRPGIGTATDLNGRFVLVVPDDAILVLSGVGYQEQEVAVGGRTSLTVVMQTSDVVLDEAVVVAFGTQRKEEVVGAVTTVDPKELKVPSSNLTTALAGRVAGMIAYQRSGEPGQDNAEFFIRGVTTFGYKVDPLILIDGVEVTTTDLARLPPDDIEAFSIMKDATATALYGARGANGVILVNTKHGAEGKTRYFVRVENSISSPTRNVELADPVTYMRLSNEAALTRDPLAVLMYTRRKIDNTDPANPSYMYPATDWQRILLKDYTMNQRANINVSGGGRVSRYYISGTFAQDNGLLKVPKINNFNNNIDLKTYSVRSNVTVNLSPTTEATVRVSGRFEDYNGPINGGSAVYDEIMHTNPVLFPAYFEPDEANQFTKHILFGNYENGQYNNPYANMVKGYKQYSSSTLNAQIDLKQNLSFLLEGLDFSAMVNTSRYGFFDVVRSYSPFWYRLNTVGVANPEDEYRLHPINPDGGTEYLDYPAGGGNREITSLVYGQAILNYNTHIRDKHTLRGSLVFQIQESLSGQFSSLQTSLPFRNMGLSGRTTYTYDGRYNAEFNFGYNGSERFARKNRFGFFPSFGVSWNVHNESFWANARSAVNSLRLKATYGLVGNDAIGSATDRFFYLSEVNMNDAGRGATFGDNFAYSRPGVSVSRDANANVTWEVAKMTNIGLQMKLFDQLGVEADFFHQHRTNILMTRAGIPANIGLGTVIPRANVGEATSKGMDASLDYSHTFNENLWLQGRANFTYATSAYRKYEESVPGTEPWLSRVGYPLSQQWGFIAERLFVDDIDAANAPRQSFGEYGRGDIKYKDVNGDGQITNLDRVPIGYPTSPEIVYGFGFSLGYKSLDVSAFFQGLARESFWIDASATSPFQGQTQLLAAYADDYWSEENQNIYALWPRLSPTINDNNTQRSTWFMRNGEFLRLKQAEVGFTLPKSLKDRVGVENARLYVNGTNLFVISRFNLWDVEMAGNGLGYPVQRVINVGVTLNF